MLLVDGKFYDFQPLPAIFFGHQKPLAYVLNPKVASTLTLNFIFYVNHGYRYYDPMQIYHSPVALFCLRVRNCTRRFCIGFCSLRPNAFPSCAIRCGASCRPSCRRCSPRPILSTTSSAIV